MALLEVRNISRNFGGNRAVDNVSFDVQAGELLALIGPNGAGKSTTFNMINGQLPATSGSVRYNGRELLGVPSRKMAGLGIARTFQIAATFASLTVRENVQMALVAHRRKLRSFWRPLAAYYPQEAMRLLEQVGMAEQAGRPCSELAYGDVKRVELAMGLAAEPRLLLMDEPTAGMAPAERNALVGLVKKLVLDRGMAVLFTEHSMDVVFSYADRVLVLARGQVIAQGSVDDVRQNARVQEVYLGSGATYAQLAPAPTFSE